MVANKGSRVQVLRGNAEKTSTGMTADKLKKNSSGRVVSKSKSKLSEQSFKHNDSLQMRQIAVSELSGRSDFRDQFKAGNNKMKRDIAHRHTELMALPEKEKRALIKKQQEKTKTKKSNAMIQTSKNRGKKTKTKKRK